MVNELEDDWLYGINTKVYSEALDNPLILAVVALVLVIIAATVASPIVPATLYPNPSSGVLVGAEAPLFCRIMYPAALVIVLAALNDKLI